MMERKGIKPNYKYRQRKMCKRMSKKNAKKCKAKQV
jgi:hypothetical protein